MPSMTKGRHHNASRTYVQAVGTHPVTRQYFRLPPALLAVGRRRRRQRQRVPRRPRRAAREAGQLRGEIVAAAVVAQPVAVAHFSLRVHRAPRGLAGNERRRGRGFFGSQLVALEAVVAEGKDKGVTRGADPVATVAVASPVVLVLVLVLVVLVLVLVLVVVSPMRHAPRLLVVLLVVLVMLLLEVVLRHVLVVEVVEVLVGHDRRPPHRSRHVSIRHRGVRRMQMHVKVWRWY